MKSQRIYRERLCKNSFKCCLLLFFWAASFGAFSNDVFQIEESLKDISLSGIEEKYAEHLEAGLLSADGMYIQKGGDWNQFVTLLQNDEIKSVDVSGFSTESPAKISIPKHIKRFDIRDSVFRSGLELSFGAMDNLIIADSKFFGEITISNTVKSVEGDIYIGSNKFYKINDSGLVTFDALEGADIEIGSNEFESEAFYIDVQPYQRFKILNNTFLDGVTVVSDALRSSEFYFNSNKTHNLFTIEGMDGFLGSIVSLNNSEFFGKADFSQSLFKAKPTFKRTRFHDAFDISGTNFEKGVDLRIAKFSDNKGLYLEAFEGDLKAFQIHLQQLQKSSIKFTSPTAEQPNESERIQERLARADKVYEQLIESFKLNSLENEADELSLEHKRLSNKIDWSLQSALYDFFMGYGYETWRYIIYVVFPSIILFSLIHLKLFYKEVEIVIARRDQLSDIDIGRTSGVAKLSKVVAISSGVLFAIRYKTLWLTDNISFNHFVVFNYCFGLFLYILFALGTRVSSFDIVKSMIGI